MDLAGDWYEGGLDEHYAQKTGRVPEHVLALVFSASIARMLIHLSVGFVVDSRQCIVGIVIGP